MIVMCTYFRHRDKFVDPEYVQVAGIQSAEEMDPVTEVTLFMQREKIRNRVKTRLQNRCIPYTGESLQRRPQLRQRVRWTSKATRS